MPPPSTPTKLPPASSYDGTVQIKVGAGRDPKAFTVHKSVLTFYSGYFEAALRPGSQFVEATTGAFELPDEDVDIFEKFVCWIYSRSIDCGSGPEAFPIICKLWVLADRREVPLLMNQCINELRDKVASLWIVPNTSLTYIYGNTMPGSALRRLAVDIIAKCSDSVLLDDGEANFGRDALLDILKVVWKFNPVKKWSKEDVRSLKLCPEYHSHEEGVTCGKK